MKFFLAGRRGLKLEQQIDCCCFLNKFATIMLTIGKHFKRSNLVISPTGPNLYPQIPSNTPPPNFFFDEFSVTCTSSPTANFWTCPQLYVFWLSVQHSTKIRYKRWKHILLLAFTNLAPTDILHLGLGPRIAGIGFMTWSLRQTSPGIGGLWTDKISKPWWDFKWGCWYAIQHSMHDTPNFDLDMRTVMFDICNVTVASSWSNILVVF